MMVMTVLILLLLIIMPIMLMMMIMLIMTMASNDAILEVVKSTRYISNAHDHFAWEEHVTKSPCNASLRPQETKTITQLLIFKKLESI